jgi:thioredoxin-like negative regulator of GroEL
MTSPLALALLLAGSAGEHPATPVVAIKWEKKFDDALREAKHSGRPIVVDFWAEWCGWCHRLERTTYADPTVIRRAQGFVAVRVNAEGSRRELEVCAKYGVGERLPVILFLSPQGHQLFRVEGYQGPGQFPRTLDLAHQVGVRVMGWEAAIEASPNEPGPLLALGRHMLNQGYYQDATELLRRTVDNDAAASVGARREARTLLAMLAQASRDFREAERLVKEALSLAPDATEQPQLLFVLGRTYISTGRPEEGAATFEVIVERFPKSPVAEKAKESLTTLRASQKR